MRRFFLILGTVALGVTVVLVSPVGASKGYPQVGQSPAVWKAYYGQHAPTTAGYYGPPVHNSTQGKTYLFSAVTTDSGLDSGIVDNYTINLPDRTTLHVAENYVMRNMPDDATFGPLTVIHSAGESCAVVDIASVTLAKIFDQHPQIDDPLGVMGVTMYWINSNLNDVYSASNVQEMIVWPAPVNKTGCP